MPELPEEMYCSEQINIPPAFPYLLRQFAKAAIRSQPTDLLRWSAAYFRCLSLNIPPPVKPRLEYPIPRDHRGITPGWLKALMYQLQNNLTIPFRVLWDRWTGACLEHETLIQILCLGGFTEPQAVPWLRFIALCAAHLTDDLTHTMILICEIMTEEPEGGSSIITLETFLDLYKFLANIDASQPQILKNRYFRDSLLALWRQKADDLEKAEEIHEETVAEEPSLESKESEVSAEIASKKDDIKEVISCPSIVEDDYSIDYFMKQIPGEDFEEEPEGIHEEEPIQIEEEIHEEAPLEEKAEEEETAIVEPEVEQGSKSSVHEEETPEKAEEEEDKEATAVVEDEDKAGEEQEDTHKDIEEEMSPEDEEIHEERRSKKSVEISELPEAHIEEMVVEEQQIEDKEGVEPQEGDEVAVVAEIPEDYESVSTIQEERKIEDIFEDEKTLQEDLERLKVLQLEMQGETDEELEKYKCRLIEEMPLSKSQEDAIEHFKKGESGVAQIKAKSEIESVASKESVEEEEETSEQREMKKYEDVYVDAIPGIGPIVPEELIKAVDIYMRDAAKNQHGMVMPRNIRHFNCPPLEVLEY